MFPILDTLPCFKWLTSQSQLGRQGCPMLDLRVNDCISACEMLHPNCALQQVRRLAARPRYLPVPDFSVQGHQVAYSDSLISPVAGPDGHRTPGR